MPVELSEEEYAKLKESAEKAAALEASKQRVIEESERFKKRAQEAEGKLTESEKRKLEEEGKLSEALALERKEKEELRQKYESKDKLILKEKLRTELTKVAKDAIDVDDLLLIQDSEARSLLKTDAESLTISGVEEFVAKARELKPHYFGRKAMPDYNNLKTGNDDSNEDHAKSDEQRYIEELKACNSRAEVVKVKKKYGKPVDDYLNR